MQRQCYAVVFVLVLLFTALFTARAQKSDVTGRQWLENFSSQRTARWKAERAVAESLARAGGMPIRVEDASGGVMELQRFEQGLPVYYATDNLTAAKTVSTNKLWPGAGFGYALTGDSVTLGEWDGGIALPTHQEFQGRITPLESTPNFHSTHVAGTMVASGVDPNAHGMSPKATIRGYDFSNDDGEMATEAAGGLRASNHSYGQITGWRFNYLSDNRWAWFGDTVVSNTEDYKFGFYDAQAQTWDDICRNAPYYLICKSAGNDRNEGPGSLVTHWVFINSHWVLRTTPRLQDGRSGGYDCIASAGLAKNVLTVAAVNGIPGGYNGTSSVVMSSFSSWGPTDDGRIKPDISADGVNLYSTLETANNAYGFLSGTSMATPNVTGSVGLLLQRQRQLHGATPILSSTLKALIIGTADEAGPNPGPDYMFGWGLLNTYKAIQLMSADSADGFGTHIKEIPMATGDTIRFEVSCDGTAPLRATICWTDPSGNPVAPSLNPPNRMLINDIDLRVTRKRDKVKYFPWTLNPALLSAAAIKGDNIRDNVERVDVDTIERGVYTVQITHKGVIGGGPQIVSIVVTGNVRAIGPYIVANRDSSGYGLLPGATKTDSVTLHNYGDTTLLYTIDPPAAPWLTVVESSGSVPPLDSVRIHYTASATFLHQWSTQVGEILVDGPSDPFRFPVGVTVLGPIIHRTSTFYAVDVDSAGAATRQLRITNSGFIPLTVTLADSNGPLPGWLQLSTPGGTVNVGDSLVVTLTLNNSNEPLGHYETTLQIASNDSSTGTLYSHIDLHVGTRRFSQTSIAARWNIVSLPVTPFSFLKADLYPGTVAGAYGYTGEDYLLRDTLEKGAGYWVKYSAGQTVGIDGYTFAAETTAVHEGWNLIGALSNSVPIGAISSNPAGILSPAIYGYDGGYYLASTLDPGKGYWAFSSGAGSVYLSGTYQASPKNAIAEILGALSSITISDQGGNRQSLYFGPKSGTAGQALILPPKAPSGGFDARFASGQYVEYFIPQQGVKVDRSVNVDATGPLTVEWNIRDPKSTYSISGTDGTMRMVQKGSLRLPAGTRTITLGFEPPAIPKEFALEQNYPNPFNPSTTIRYDLPSESHVTIKLYNILGNEVAVLADGTQDAGIHSVTLDASALPTGVYIYKMQAGDFSAVRKLMVVR